MIFSATEENYIKTIFHLSEVGGKNISTNDIAKAISATPASVTDMLKKLKEKKIISYEKYYGVKLTPQGKRVAKTIVRKHRLWEVFLVEKLDYSWDKVHDIAEQLEHIRSDELVDKLDEFLGYPKFDPHGDPIPDAQGNMESPKQTLLSKLDKGYKGKVVGVKDNSSGLLTYLNDLNVSLGTPVEVLDIIAFDGSFVVLLNHKDKVSLSKLVTQNVFVG